MNERFPLPYRHVKDAQVAAPVKLDVKLTADKLEVNSEIAKLSADKSLLTKVDQVVEVAETDDDKSGKRNVSLLLAVGFC